MSAAVIQQALVDQLRVRPMSKGELRAVIGCSAAELAGAIQALRYQGKLSWDSLTLSPSMIEQDAAAVSTETGAAEGGGQRDGDPAKMVNAPLPSTSSDAAGSSKVPVAEGAAPMSASSNDASPSAEGEEEDGAAPGHADPDTVPSSITNPEGGAADAPHAPSSGPDDEDDYPGEVNDAVGGGRGRRRGWGCKPDAGFVSRKGLHDAGVHAAATRAGAKPIPAPAHEPEVARQVREEVNEGIARRSRARSTGTVRVPLELRKFNVPDLSLKESVVSLFAEQPQDLMRAINRKHPQLWRRIILLGRSRGEGPAQALYAALEAGLAELEPAAANAA